VSGERQVLAYDRVGRRTAYCSADPHGPEGIFVVDGDSAPRQVVGPNVDLRRRFELVEIRRRTFSVQGAEIDAWTYRSRETRKNAPLALSLHGGPQGYAGHAYSALHFYRYVLASKGWVAVTANPTGSATYGRAFAEGVRERWGSVDAAELLAIVESMCADGTANGQNVAVTGYSYGGYLAASLINQTRRFRAAVIGAPITNLESYFGTSDIGPWFMRWQMKGTPFDRPGLYRESSPVFRAQSATTPALLLQGVADLRCPVGQSEELHVALRASGCPCELVLYEGADHDFPATGAPSQRIDFQRRVVEWLERHAGSS
jgi:dipeptidyl aminopeptidase/acylaminoacyl peptidase